MPPFWNCTANRIFSFFPSIRHLHLKFKYPMILGPSVVFEFPQLLYSAYLMISGNTTTAAAFLKYIASPKAVFLADVTEMIIGNPVSTFMTTFPAYLFLIWAKITVLNCCSFNSFHSAGVSAFGITLCLYLCFPSRIRIYFCKDAILVKTKSLNKRLLSTVVVCCRLLSDILLVFIILKIISILWPLTMTMTFSSKLKRS